mgnify:CR=1 FL=1
MFPDFKKSLWNVPLWVLLEYLADVINFLEKINSQILCQNSIIFITILNPKKFKSISALVLEVNLLKKSLTDDRWRQRDYPRRPFFRLFKPTDKWSKNLHVCILRMKHQENMISNIRQKWHKTKFCSEMTSTFPFQMKIEYVFLFQEQ